MTHGDTPVEIDYATPAPRPPARTFAAAAILFGGLGLIIVGGCFLIGVMLTIEKGFNGSMSVSPAPLTTRETVLVWFLVILAVTAFAGAVLLLIIGTRALLRVIRM